jgi:O-acetyl-ADP-ribose deacetylase (regulator of RNase III)
MQHVKGNILNVEQGVICQQVNCKLIMGAGLAKQIRNKWPQVYTEYRSIISTRPYLRLGRC